MDLNTVLIHAICLFAMGLSLSTKKFKLEFLNLKCDPGNEVGTDLTIIKCAKQCFHSTNCNKFVFPPLERMTSVGTCILCTQSSILEFTNQFNVYEVFDEELPMPTNNSGIEIYPGVPGVNYAEISSDFNGSIIVINRNNSVILHDAADEETSEGAANEEDGADETTTENESNTGGEPDISIYQEPEAMEGNYKIHKQVFFEGVDKWLYCSSKESLTGIWYSSANGKIIGIKCVIDNSYFNWNYIGLAKRTTLACDKATKSIAGICVEGDCVTKVACANYINQIKSENLRDHNVLDSGDTVTSGTEKIRWKSQCDYPRIIYKISGTLPDAKIHCINFTNLA